MNRLTVADSRRKLRHAVLLSTSAALVTAAPAFAVCDNHTRGAGQSVVCDTSPPNPDTVPVEAVPGSTTVTVNILAGSQLTVMGNGVLLQSGSTTANSGAITTSGDLVDGMSASGSGNALRNLGAITTSGVSSEGMFSGAPGNTLINETTGRITTSGQDARG